MTHDRTYLGDGVYASFEHGMIWLRASAPTGGMRSHSEPYVYHALTEYAAMIWGAWRAAGAWRIHARPTSMPGWIEPA
jgi:hypothetical protein